MGTTATREYGPDGLGAAGGVSRSTLWQADDTTTRPLRSGPTRQSDARYSEANYLLLPPKHGPGCLLFDPMTSFLCEASVLTTFRAEHLIR